jgi:hypothetical protein
VTRLALENGAIVTSAYLEEAVRGEYNWGKSSPYKEVRMGHPQILTSDSLHERFGNFRWKANGESAIEIIGSWVEDHITSVYIPNLDGVMTYGGKFSGRVRWHKDGIEQLQHAFAEIEDKGLSEDIIFWGGSFVPRRVRGGTTLSRHSWAIALDINPEQNPFMRPVASKGSNGCVLRLVPILEKHGFAWGGRWEDRTDGMHFEVCEPRDYQTLVEDSGVKLILDGMVQAIPISLKNGISYASLKKLALATNDEGVIIDRDVPLAQYLRGRGYDVIWVASRRQIIATKM